MKRIIARAVIAGLCVAALSACSQQNIKDVLTNLDKDCTRHYQGSAATGVPSTATITFTIDCVPSGAPIKPPTP